MSSALPHNPGALCYPCHMVAPEQFSFREVTRDDFSMLRRWQTRPHVREWWDDDEPLSEEDLRDTRVRQWIVSTGGRPFAFMQDYTVHGWPDHHFFQLPQGSRGIDQYIGEPDMIGRGLGPAFIAARVAALFRDGAPVVATDPHPANARAIAAYKKAGFEPFGPPRDTPWGLILPMKVGSPGAAQR